MRHHYTIQEGFYRLRPADLDDTEFIVALRTNGERNRFINTTSPDIAQQRDWFRRYFETAGDYYFVIEHVPTGRREGTLGIYDVDEPRRSAEWGRWVVSPGSKAALSSCCLAFDLAFGDMNLQSLHSYVAAENRSVIALLQAVGMVEQESVPHHLFINGQPHDAVKMRMAASDWKGTG